MKKLLLLLACAATATLYAQTKEGKVVYERTTQITLPNIATLPAEVQARLPKSRTDQFELLFTAQHSLYQNLPSATNEGASGFEGGGVVMRVGGGGNTATYINFESGVRTEQREVLEKTFLVTDTLTRLKWKLSEETKPILNFTAHKATATRIETHMRMAMENGVMKREPITDTVLVVAWYTTQVPVPAGPEFAGQLPGLILEVDAGAGRSVTRALSYSPVVAANKIKAPGGGKKVTATEYTAERDKLLEEMRKNMPAGNVIRMQ